MSVRALLPMEAREKLDDADFTLMAIRAVSDLLCELPDMHMVQPEQLNALLCILADRLEAALDI